jgi:hypothetical protein
MELKWIVFGFLAFALPTSAANAQSWMFEYSVGETAEEITSCNARIDYRDGLMVTRIYGEQMDFFFAQTSLALPPGQVLGNVALVFKADTFVLSAASASSTEQSTVSAMFLTPEKKDYSPILDSMKRGESLTVVFPDTSSFEVSLSGSETALDQVGTCWTRNETGPAGRNPFNAAEGVNPFN